ncbi:MAG: tRNA pseudouridine(13) synthase TruD [Thermoplasmata archaeon]
MEREVGIELFYTSIPGIGGRLKKYPEDFQVEENIDKDKIEESEGEYTIAKVWSRNWETNRLVRRFSKLLGISRRGISFAGTKDKRAVTTQWMSFHTEPDDLDIIDLKDVEISDIRRSHRPLYIGAHESNTFDIKVREIDLTHDEIKKRTDSIGSEIQDIGGFPNYFGVQRFGTLRPITHLVGKKLIMGDFQGAVKMYIANPMESESGGCREARERLEETWDYKEALSNYPKILTFERSMIHYLAKKTEDYIGALQELPDNLLKMFVHAYQSYLFNKMLSRRLQKGLPLKDALAGDILLPADRNGAPNVDTPVHITDRNLEKASNMVRGGKAYVSAPLFGFSSKFSEGEQGEIEKEIIEKENIDKRDFVIPEISNLSSKGTRRSIFAPVHDLNWSVEPDCFNIKFTLLKGTYATTLLREFMKLPDDKSHLYS